MRQDIDVSEERAIFHPLPTRISLYGDILIQNIPALLAFFL